MSWLTGCQQLPCLAKQPAGRVTGWRAGAANPTRNETDITNLAHELYMNRDINLMVFLKVSKLYGFIYLDMNICNIW